MYENFYPLFSGAMFQNATFSISQRFAQSEFPQQRHVKSGLKAKGNFRNGAYAPGFHKLYASRDVYFEYYIRRVERDSWKSRVTFAIPINQNTRTFPNAFVQFRLKVHATWNSPRKNKLFGLAVKISPACITRRSVHYFLPLSELIFNADGNGNAWIVTWNQIKKRTRYRVINWRTIMPINDGISRFHRYFVLAASKNVQNNTWFLAILIHEMMKGFFYKIVEFCKAYNM